MPSTNKTLDPLSKQLPAKKAHVFHSELIPKAFWLGGFKIDVQLDDSFVEKHGCLGQSIYAAQKIILDPGAAPLQTVEQGYLHELVHWILFMMSEEELRNNERHVDLFAHFLYQALTSAEKGPATAALRVGAGTFAEHVDPGAWLTNSKNLDDCTDGCDDDDPGDYPREEADRLAAEAYWEEQEEWQLGRESWANAAEDWARSEDEGWYYGDGD